MIYRLQRNFILVCTVSVLTVIAFVFALLSLFNISSMNRNLDILADNVFEGGGRFPDRFHETPPPHREEPSDREFDFITPETPFATRHFTVWFDESGAVTRVNTESIRSVTEEQAKVFANKAVAEGDDGGWISNYRYKLFRVGDGKSIVFIDGSMSRASMLQSLTTSALVLLGCAATVLLLVVLLSKRVVKPIAESYDKQRQFITDANHELKTPLTLILANLDIAEAELGKNEWLADIRSEGERMSELVNQLVALSRVDEADLTPVLTSVLFGEIVADVVSDFRGLSEKRHKTLLAQIDTSVCCMGDETLLRRLLSILLENAVKYCDEGGEICVTLKKRRYVILTVENTYAAVKDMELSRLFDRFYRADEARSFTGGYGIGLSIARSIVQKHRGEITAYQKSDMQIGFKIVLKS